MRGIFVCLCVLAGCIALCCAPALAKEVHIYNSSFGTNGAGAGQFNHPVGIAVDDATGDVYVVDKGNDRVEKFNAQGTQVICEFNGSGSNDGVFSGPTQIAVDNSGKSVVEDPSVGDVYVIDNGHGVIDKFNSNCEYLNQLKHAFGAGKAQGVAVDQSGTVWVNTDEPPIYGFSDAVENISAFECTTVFGGLVEGLGVDSEDNLYINSGGGEIVKIDSAKINGGCEPLIKSFGDDKSAFGVAVDSVGSEAYLDNMEEIEAFTLTGEHIESFGSGHLTSSSGIGVDDVDGTVYVTDETNDDVVIFEDIKLPTVAIGQVSDQTPKSVRLSGSVNPENRPVTSCVFEYGTVEEYEATKTYGHSIACSSSSPLEGETPVPVSAQLSGLVSGTSYDYRLVAENAAKIGSSTPNEEFFTGPLLGGEFAIRVTSDTATLEDPITPNGDDTHYYVEYGPTLAYGSYAPLPAPGTDLGSSMASQMVEVNLRDLPVDATFHYRFVIIQNDEIFEEPDHSFTTQGISAAGGLLDGRSWELVSPADKHGVLIELSEQGGQIQAATDGSGIAYMTEGASVNEGPAGKLEFSQVLSRRGPAGWSTTDLTLPGRLPQNGESIGELFHAQPEYHLFSPDLSLAAVEPQIDGTPPLSAGVTERTLYLRNNVNGVFSPLVDSNDVIEGTQIEEPSLNYPGIAANEFEMHFLAATPDLAHIVFKTPMALTPEAFHEETAKGRAEELAKGGSPDAVQWNLYEWDNSGEIQLVNVLPGGEVAYGRLPTVPPVRLAGMSNGAGLGRGGSQRAVSVDGRRVVWTWGEPYGVELNNYRGLFVRDMVEERTVRVGGPTAIYQTMNSSGSEIFYIEDGDLFVYNFESGETSDLTTDHAVGEPSGSVQEVVSDVSEDGSYVYFVAKGALAGSGVRGGYNLYLLHDTSNGWVTSLVATLSAEDMPSWYAENDTAPFLAHISSRVSPDGRFLAFMSDVPLTGYDNKDIASGEPDEEVFLYDAEAKRLVCASCDPSGARPVGVYDSEYAELFVDRAAIWTGRESTTQDKRINHWLAGSVPGWDNLDNNPSTYQPRYLSDSGRLFFDSPDALVAQDTNGLEDAYEFEPVGVGSCVAGGPGFGERSDGCVGLVSSGTSSSESAFYDASESGNDVFFATTGKLVNEDYDKGYDLYDAHVCSDSEPCVTGPVVSPPCSSGDSCKAAPMAQPEIFGPAPSATFNGVGNVTIPAANVRKKSLTNAQKLARAFKVCHKEKGKRRRVCESRARKHYPLKPVRKTKSAHKKGK